MTNLTPKIPVPAQDSAANAYIEDVIGNKIDTDAGNSLYALAHVINEHDHATAKVYPTLSDGVTVAAGNAWILGSFTEIVPASTITSPFDIHFIGVEEISDIDVYELVLYKGAVSSEIEIGRVRFTRDTNLSAVMNQPFQTEIIAANERISAKVACSLGQGAAVIISIFYHTY